MPFFVDNKYHETPFVVDYKYYEHDEGHIQFAGRLWLRLNQCYSHQKIAGSLVVCQSIKW